ncbi:MULTISPECIES: hypothetical protein [Streptomyces]|uniref:Uncharacterized protein n=2 Tax=Streptomyces spectabilis TaxID=68270 RepID=A0A516RJJ8_STRST|nr:MULTISPECIES: hypothetical protein [Streptomyces]QDQ15838.1 hypothetical protein FH965_39175 [Streptomyces spectabilis]QEV64246.1 hypothetical protein CP982_40775 [Streptomyces spectabilis]
MTRPCTTSTAKEEAPMGEFRTYSFDPEKHVRAYADTVHKACRDERRSTRARTHSTIAKVPNAAMPLGAAMVSICMTVTMLLFWGISTAVALQLGAGMATLYTATNDVRISVVRNNPGWRQRHRILARLIPQHPVD